MSWRESEILNFVTEDHRLEIFIMLVLQDYLHRFFYTLSSNDIPAIVSLYSSYEQFNDRDIEDALKALADAQYLQINEDREVEVTEAGEAMASYVQEHRPDFRR